ncbi:metallophosphoesterase family protein [Roseibium sp. CAU 1637]|uniref:Metallophosphoesterase family protein n=1 Tax=Roseibium limicola TaxID=2816037 RepID=A0A939EPW5_9HYPH|nr:metallophosphoesterase family protein [Roseibium limicola]MBO0344929.1 metallophosphoesterase family protein [Roseibium limicola]
MKIAVVADIHGNLPALEAVIADLSTERPDQVVNLGDCVSGPLWPDETGRLLMQRDWPTVRGNHDRVAVGPKVPASNRTDHFTQAHLSEDVTQWLRLLPQVIQLTEEITLFHATPEVDDLYLTETVIDGRGVLSSVEEIDNRLAGATAAPLLLCGHTHIPRLLTLPHGQTIFNPGSVGCPAYSDALPSPHVMEAGSPHCRYGFLEFSSTGWVFTHKSIAYDWHAAESRARTCERPDWADALKHGVLH